MDVKILDVHFYLQTIKYRNYLEYILKAEVINFYGASESLALGVEMDTAEGMILFDDMNVIEVQNGNMYLKVVS